MFESIEIRRVANGFVVMIVDEEHTETEYVFDTSRKALKFIKDKIESNKTTA